MQIAEVRWVMYCVTVVVGGGIDVMMACWNAWRLFDSLTLVTRELLKNPIWALELLKGHFLP